MTLKTKFAATTTALGLALAPLAVGPALAQTSTPDQGEEGGAEMQMQQPSMASSDVSDEQLQAFVDTALEVQSVQEEYRAEAEAAADEEELQSIAEEANSEIVSVVENAENMTMDEYVAISEAAQADQELMGRITALLQERQGENAPADG